MNSSQILLAMKMVIYNEPETLASIPVNSVGLHSQKRSIFEDDSDIKIIHSTGR